MIICVCNNVSESELRKAIADGADSLSQISQATGLGRNCGGCLHTAKLLLKEEREQLLAANPNLFYAA